MSRLFEERNRFVPTLPDLLQDMGVLQSVASLIPAEEIAVSQFFPKLSGKPLLKFKKGAQPASRKPYRVGTFFSGGQAPGGHNVVWGLCEALRKNQPQSELIGFLGGPLGLLENHFKPLLAGDIQPYRNSGGFDLLGSGRTKIETLTQFQKVKERILEHRLDALVVIGGDDSNTNAAHLAEYLLKEGLSTLVIGIPKTIDGDLTAPQLPISFGFDTACKVYSEMIGNLAKDALSAKKYVHFIKLMGRAASHVTLECALQTKPNLSLIAEEIAHKKMTLHDIVDEIAELLVRRSKVKKPYGIILIPEGLIEFIPEMQALIKELNVHKTIDQLSPKAHQTFSSLPQKIQQQLLMDRDPHGNVQVSHIATDELIVHLVKSEIGKRGDYLGKFSPVCHTFGYEGRSAYPSNFDATYCYALGHVAVALITLGSTGYLASLEDLHQESLHWKPCAIPLVSMMKMEERKGKQIPVIAKTLVDLQGPVFQEFEKNRDRYKLEDHYTSPGPMQFFGPREITDCVTKTLEVSSC